jgi:hypothetical protein
MPSKLKSLEHNQHQSYNMIRYEVYQNKNKENSVPYPQVNYLGTIKEKKIILEKMCSTNFSSTHDSQSLM